MQGKSSKGGKKLAASPKYMSPSQLSLEGFETPFERNLNKNNRWVRLATLG
jgi:IS5 family transposase